MGEENCSYFDRALRYDFGQSNYKVVPFVLIGVSYNFQLIYTISKDGIQTQRFRLYPYLVVVYRFSTRNLNPRIWQD